MKKSKKVFVGIKGEPIGIESGAKDNKYLQGVSAKPEIEKRVKPAKLISRLNYPESVKYGENTINISPRGKMIVGDMDKVGKLPQGIILKKI